MAGQPGEPQGQEVADRSNGRLDSWKEIALYLRRDVRTVRRWEKSQGLPVHRHQHQKAASVYAYRAELDAWWTAEKERLSDLSAPDAGAGPAATPAETAATVSLWQKYRRVCLSVGAVAAISIAGLFFFLRKSQPSIAHAGRLMVAVLPFENLTGEPAQEFVSDGFTEEMITQLSAVGEDRLGVIARTSSMAYKGTRKPVVQIGQELGVDYVLEGSVRRWGDQVRVTAQLIHVKSQTHLWAEDFETSQRDILTMESEITQAIARQIHLQLLPAAARSPGQQSVDPQAHELYLKGLYYLEQRDRADLLKSIDSFHQAITHDPQYAAAYAGLADAYNLIAFYGLDSSLDSVTEAKIAADKALTLDGSMAAAHAAEAYTDFMWQGNWQRADQEFRRAIDLDDNYVLAHQWYALYLAAAGRTGESVRQMQYAKALDPVSPSAHAGLAYMNYFAQNYQQAAESARTALQLNPHTIPAHAVLGWVDIEQKNYSEAIAELQTAARLSGNAPVYLCGLARAYALSGNRKQADTLVREVAKGQARLEGSGAALASAYLAAGDTEAALAWLEKTGPGDIQANFLRVDPAFDSLRQNPRFQAVVDRIGATSF